MRTTKRTLAAALVAVLSLLAAPVRAGHESLTEVPAGTRFLVELKDKLDARKAKVGKKFGARTIEPLHASNGAYLKAGAKLKGRVTHVEKSRLLLRFETIDTGKDKVPIVATVVGVVGEKNVKRKVSNEGEIRAEGSNRGRNAAIGAGVGAGTGAAIGAVAGGGKEAAIGAGVGAGAGALVGALSSGSKPLVLQKKTRIELELDRPLAFEPRNR
ncbi:MAG TPA: hypothetical protein VNN18_06895 [Candidatus Xenobia bacterium]|nr:hypothetical protein [Candidatus Xenobia bacterium]